MTDKQLNTFSTAIIHLESYSKGLSLSVSNSRHWEDTVKQLNEKLPAEVQRLKTLYLEMGGENYWK